VKHLVLLAIGVPLVAGCATAQPASPTAATTIGGACRNDNLQQFVSQPATGDLGTRILAASGARSLQWVAAGTMVTMEFREDRVRVALDERNNVQRVSCG
jgi:hypothetical protein